MSANEDILNQFFKHATKLHNFNNRESRKIKELLEKLRQRILEQLANKNITLFQKRKMKALLEQIDAMYDETYTLINNEIDNRTQRLFKVEGNNTAAIMNKAIGVPIISVAWNDAFIKATIDDSDIFGLTNKEWFAKVKNKSQKRIEDLFTSKELVDEIQLGLLEGRTLQNIVKNNIAFVKDKQLTDSEIEAVTRTIINNVSNTARNQVYKENDDVIEGLEWLSTLDKRTSKICIARDGKKYTVDGKPIGHSITYDGGPPAHFRCRSTMLPVMRPFSEIDEEDVFKKRDVELTNSKRKRMRAALDGQVPGNTDYEKWLKSRSKVEAIEVLGEKVYGLWSSGAITLSQLINNKGEELTFSQLENISKL